MGSSDYAGRPGLPQLQGIDKRGGSPMSIAASPPLAGLESNRPSSTGTPLGTSERVGARPIATLLRTARTDALARSCQTRMTQAGPLPELLRSTSDRGLSSFTGRG